MLTPGLILRRMRNVSEKTCRENESTHLMSKMFSENRAVYEIMWEKYGTARQVTDDNITRCMRTAFRITKAADTNSEYIIITAFPRQQMLRESASVLHL
jgi:hypothetical protein